MLLTPPVIEDGADSSTILVRCQRTALSGGGTSASVRRLACIHRVKSVVRHTSGSSTMSIFSRIKDAIFGAQAKAAPSTPPAAKPAPSATPTAAPKAAPPPAASSTSAAPANVDVEAVLTQLAANQSQKLNWRTSIVDLMKLVGLDSSLENRKELARELGYKGDTNDSAAMNIWLHKQVMTQLAAHGGKVPPELKD